MDVEFPQFPEDTLFMSEICERSGAPTKGEQEGKAAPTECF